MDETSIVTQHTVCPHQQIVSHWVPEHLHSQSVSDYLFCLAVQVGVDQCHIIITSDTVAQSWEFFLHTNNFCWLWERISDISEFVVSSVVRNNKSFLVASCGPAYNPGSSYCGLDHRDEWTKLTFESAVEIVGASGSHQAVTISQFREHSDIVRVLVLNSVRHYILLQILLSLLLFSN